MNKFFATVLGALIGLAIFAAVGVELAHAGRLAPDDGYGVARPQAGVAL